MTRQWGLRGLATTAFELVCHNQRISHPPRWQISGLDAGNGFKNFVMMPTIGCGPECDHGFKRRTPGQLAFQFAHQHCNLRGESKLLPHQIGHPLAVLRHKRKTFERSEHASPGQEGARARPGGGRPRGWARIRRGGLFRPMHAAYPARRPSRRVRQS